MKFTKESVNELKNLIKTDDDFQKSNIENLDEKISEFVTDVLDPYICGDYDFLDVEYLDVSWMKMQIYDEEQDSNPETVLIDLDMIWAEWMNKFSKYF